MTVAERTRSARLRGDVQRLCADIGERNFVAYRGLQHAAEFVAGSLAESGYAVECQDVAVPEFARHAARRSSGGAVPAFVNVIAQLEGAELPGEILVVGAHYDSVAVPGCVGADDNASAVAGLLAIARELADRRLRRTVRFAAFVNEEPPFFESPGMGSLAYAARCRAMQDRIIGMICLEMIGYYDDTPGSQQYPFPIPLSWFYPNRGDFIGFVANPASRHLLRRVVRSFRRTTPFPSVGAAVPSWIPGVSLSDHGSFWHHGYPAIMVTDTAMFRYPWYHTAQDDPERLDFDRMARVVGGLLEAVASLADE
ncbi:MAG: M28 family peptidase [Pirellulaceae bacterium]|nr:M28 family peptidase [Pirellulaceae bacterium]